MKNFLRTRYTKVETQYSQVPFISIWETAIMPNQHFDQECQDMLDCGYSLRMTRQGVQLIIPITKNPAKIVSSVLANDLALVDSLRDIGYEVKQSNIEDYVHEAIEDHKMGDYDSIAAYVYCEAARQINGGTI